MDHSDTIAWLVPSSGNTLALQAIQMPQNAALATTDSPNLTPATTALGFPSSTTDPGPPALRLSFSTRPKSHLGFVLGTDPSCDVVLPKFPGISRRHCHLTFDAESRLVLRDTSKNGTAVWYDHRSNGDRRDFSWVLNSGSSHGFPDQVGRVVIDVQAVRFQIVVNGPAGDDVEGYERRVDEFLVELARRREEAAAVPPPLFSGMGGRGRGAGFVKHIVVEEGKRPQTFLWNVARPWDPIIPINE